MLDDWSVSGTNTIRLEEYAIAGDETSSIFPFEGFQPYDELSVRFARADSPYDRWRGEFVGLLNESDYRSPNDGIVLERFNLTREKGDGSLPHRLEVGDYFGYFSYRTLQRTLKGGQIDLQPRGGWAGERHSVQVLSGFVNSSYRDLDPLEDYYNGASWLVSHPDWGNFSLNGVHNIRKSDPDAGRSADVSQGVISAAAERGFTLGTHGVSLEGEIAGFLGDAQSGTTVREDERDIGYFAQLSGRDQGPLSYGARFEYYGRDFRPNGAVIVPNRRTYELRSAWRFDDGQRLRGRLQRFTDDVESAVSLDTKVAGVTLTGPLSLDMLPGLTSRLDASIRDIERGDGSFDTFTRIVSWDLSAPLTDAWSGRLGLLYRTIDDKPRAVETITREVRIGGDRAVRYRFLSGIFSAGLVMRDATGGSPVGIVVYAHAPLELALRNQATDSWFSRNPKRLNRCMRILRRLVIHPDLRGTGLSHHLVRKTLPLVGTQYVECLAAMGEFNPVFEKAGMRRIGQYDLCGERKLALVALRKMDVDPNSREFVSQVSRRRYVREIVSRVVYNWYAATTAGGEARVARQSPEFLAQTFRGLVGSRPVYYLWKKT